MSNFKSTVFFLLVVLLAVLSYAGILSPLFGDTPEDRSKNVSNEVAIEEASYIRDEFPCGRDGAVFQRGVASWYGPGFHGRIMANGKPFDMEQLTVAHRTIRLGTKVCISNPINGREVLATVTDRGPYVGYRVIDLSKRVADELGITEQGIARVEIRIEVGTLRT